MRFDRPIAHRGQHDRAAGIIENTRSAFSRAVASGYAIECDLQLTADGKPVVIHDPETTRLLGRPGRVRDMTAAEIGRVPLVGSSAGDCPEPFPALLDLVAGRVLLQVELKQQRSPEDIDRLAAAAVAEANSYSGPLVFEAFDPNMLIALHRHGWRGQLGIISERYDRDNEEGLNALQCFVLRNFVHFPLTRFDFLSVKHTALGLPMVRAFHAMGKPVTSWTIRSAELARKALDGADQIVFEGFDPDAELRHDPGLIRADGH